MNFLIKSKLNFINYLYYYKKIFFLKKIKKIKTFKFYKLPIKDSKKKSYLFLISFFWLFSLLIFIWIISSPLFALININNLDNNLIFLNLEINNYFNVTPSNSNYL